MREVRPRNGALLAVVVVTVLAVIDVSAGSSIVLAGLMTAGPCLAAISQGPRGVVAVGAYSVGLLDVLSWPDRLWWTTEQLLFLLALIGVTGVSSVAADRRRRTEQLIAQTEAERARAEAVNAATTGFLSRASHELRTPLNAMLGFTELLERDDLSATQREATQQISIAGQHLLDLVNEVLDVTAIEAGRLTLSVEPTSVDEVIRDAVAMTAPFAEVHGITVGPAPAEDSGLYVRADPQRLRQVLLNLLSNAVKFNRPAGAVTIRPALDSTGGVAIAVSDTGPGISAADAAKLFMPFERLDASLAGVDGTGLGLALSRGLAEAMGGSLTVSSSPGAGATFTVTVPRAAAPATELASTAPAVAAPTPPTPAVMPPGSAAATARVLYVEDNLANVRLVQRILQRRPRWELTHAAGGAEGLELALSSRFDLVLLDQHLPDMEGLVITRRIREQADRSKVPIFMVSADASPGQQQRALEAGANGYLVKPYTVDELLSLLDSQAPVT
jgi:signal transduction histidine kinase